jgi:hypothetical protein
MNEKMEKAISILTLLYFFSLAFDFTVSVTTFLRDKEYFLNYEMNQFFKKFLIDYDFISLFVVAFASSLPFLLSSWFFFFNRKIKGIHLLILFIITSSVLIILTIGHIFGGLSWLI